MNRRTLAVAFLSFALLTGGIAIGRSVTFKPLTGARDCRQLVGGFVHCGEVVTELLPPPQAAPAPAKDTTPAKEAK